MSTRGIDVCLFVGVSKCMLHFIGLEYIEQYHNINLNILERVFEYKTKINRFGANRCNKYWFKYFTIKCIVLKPRVKLIGLVSCCPPPPNMIYFFFRRPFFEPDASAFAGGEMVIEVSSISSFSCELATAF